MPAITFFTITASYYLFLFLFLEQVAVLPFSVLCWLDGLGTGYRRRSIFPSALGRSTRIILKAPTDLSFPGTDKRRADHRTLIRERK